MMFATKDDPEHVARYTANRLTEAAARCDAAAFQMEEVKLLNRREENEVMADLAAEAQRKLEELAAWMREASEV